MPWNLYGIYNKVYSLVYTIGNITDSPKEYFHVLYLKSWVTKWYIEADYLISLREFTATVVAVSSKI